MPARRKYTDTQRAEMFRLYTEGHTAEAIREICLAGTASLGTGRWTDTDLARRILFADCEDEDAQAAVRRLRPQARTPYEVPCALEELPAVRSTYVVCSEDRLVNPVWSRRVVGGRLRAELVELPGSHSPFLSRPRVVAELLHGLAT